MIAVLSQSLQRLRALSAGHLDLLVAEWSLTALALRQAMVIAALALMLVITLWITCCGIGLMLLIATGLQPVAALGIVAGVHLVVLAALGLALKRIGRDIGFAASERQLHHALERHDESSSL